MTLEIVQIVQEFSTAGGVERVAWELARAFGRAGIANTVLSSTIGESVGGATKIDRIAPWLSHVPTRGLLRHVGRAVVVPCFTFAATYALRRHRGAVVISHGDSLRGDVLVVHAVNAESLAEKRRAGERGWMLNPMHLWVALRDRWMIGGLRYRTLVAVSRRVSLELQKIYGVPEDRIRIIPNGIDVGRFRPDPVARNGIRQEFGIPADAKVLLFAGHEFRRKGLEPAIGALERLPPDVWLLVVGSDNPAPYRKLATVAADRLVFAGARRDMPAFYAAADAFVFPTAYETFSLVCMEAMASGIPVFATRVGGIEDYLEDGVNGFGIGTNPEEIAGKIGRALSDPVLIERLRAGAVATASQYGWDRVAEKYIQLLEQLDVPARTDRRAHG